MQNPTPIAIIGMGCRLPGGANSPEQLWDMLAEGRSGWGEVPADRWNWRSFYHPDSTMKESLNFKSGYFLPQNISAFDARFFGIPPSEANGMDPQQRILLEATYDAFENAGIPLESLRGTDTSVHVAVFARDYDRMAFKDTAQLHQMHVTGKGEAILSNRISYLLDLKGPSMTIDTGCSGSMVALHQACQSIRNGESTIAIAGGAQLLLHPDQSMAMNQIRMMNPEGRCYVFDDRGSGYSRGEGAGAVILKRLDLALQDGDSIHAVIANSGVNQDGRTLGIHLPNAESQAALAKSVYAAAGLDPGDTLYVEAHGTGTQAGDAAEISSISEVFCEIPNRETKLPVGSIKSNIGHLESVSGIAGLLKAVNVLKKGLIPPNIDFVNPKPSLKLDERSITIPQELTPLAPPGHHGPQRVSLNGFGYGGTNCHIILESLNVSKTKPANGISNGTSYNGDKANHSNGVEATNRDAEPPVTQKTEVETTTQINGFANGINGHTNGINGYANGTKKHDISESTPHLFVLSAASQSSLLSMATNLKDWIFTRPTGSLQLSDLAHTLGVRRSVHPWKSSFVATSADELMSQLRKLVPAKSRGATSCRISYVFTGQGAQWYAMGRELLLASKCYRESIAKSEHILDSLGCCWSLTQELLKNKEESQLGNSTIAQPATTAIQIGLVDLFASFRIVPERVCGHSSGEIAAAFAAGALSHEAAIEIAYQRGLCSALAKIANNRKGSMLATGAGESVMLPLLKQITRGKITIACINSPESTTISGDEIAIDDLSKTLKDLSIFARKLKVDTAYHSHHMQAVSDSYEHSLSKVKHGAPLNNIKFFSSVTGSRKTEGFGPQYWTANLTSQVKFSQALRSLADDAPVSSSSDVANVFMELGPHSALMGPIRQSLKTLFDGSFKYVYLAPLVRDLSAVKTMLEVVGKLFENGSSVALGPALALSRTEKPTVLDNLPAYPWDHSTTYWHESRLSRDHRLRQFPYHDLLGLLDVASDPQTPRWRHHLSTASLPWLYDHVVDGFIIFPGAGYICMAIEATSQLTKIQKATGTIKNYILRNVTFSKSLIIPEQNAIEIQITFTSVESYESGNWESFRISSYLDGTWVEHCAGIIGVEMFNKVDEVEGNREEDLKASSLRENMEQIKSSPMQRLQTSNVYNNLKASGNIFGPTFRAMEEISIGDTEAYCKVIIPNVATKMPGFYMQPHLIHPTTLDALNQLPPVLFKEKCSNSPVMPTFMGEVIISANIFNVPGSELDVAVRILAEGTKSCKADTWASQKSQDGGVSQLVVMVSNLQLCAVGEALSNEDLVPFHRKMSYKMTWQADVDSLTNQTFHDMIEKADLFDVPAQSGGMRGEIEIPLNEKAATIFIRDALRRIDSDGENVQPSHFVKMVSWMRSYVASENGLQCLRELSNDKEEAILKRSVEAGIQGKLLQRIGSNLIDILAGNVDPLTIMLKDNYLHKLYAESLAVSSSLQLAKYAQLLAYKKPRMMVLEIGAGTGGATLPLLQQLTSPSGLLLDRYHYTDISSGFFEQAREKFSEWEDQIDFRTLDISQDPLEQGYQGGTYDLVVASNIIHATPDIGSTLANIRKLLRPGGRLAMIEVTSVIAMINTIFGTLPGWWLSEDGREGSPLLSIQKWDKILLKHGYQGIEVATPDHVGPAALTSMIISKATEEPTKRLDSSREVTILQNDRSIFTDGLVRSLEVEGLNCQTAALHELEVNPSAVYIVLDNAESPILMDPTPSLFNTTKNLLSKGQSVLWVTFQEFDSPKATALKSLITGMARVVRRENEGARIITFVVNDNVSTISISKLANALAKVSIFSFWQGNDATGEREYSYQDNMVSLARLQVDQQFNKWVDRVFTNKNANTEIYSYQDSNRPLKLEAEIPGLLNTLRYVDDYKSAQTLEPDEVKIEARAYGINFKDVFVALGQMPPEVTMVGEFSGIITAVGSDVKSMYEVGDRVAGVAAEPFASHPKIKGLECQKLPDVLDFVNGASVVTVFYTAWYCLESIAKLSKGQSVLIHAASGGVGQAAIQLAQHIGAEIFVTVGSSAKVDLVVEKYNIPRSHVFSSRLTTFKQGILRLTKNRGVDVVLNSLSGEALSRSWECIAPFGTFLEIGKTDIYKRKYLSMAQFDKSVTFAAVDIALLTKARPEMIHTGLKSVFSYFEQGFLYPVYPVTTFPMGQIHDAFRLIATRKHTGKLVMIADKQTKVKASPLKPSTLNLGGGTYIVAGGLGDLGKRICVLLASKGAGNIVSFSRRTLDDNIKQEFKKDIEQLGSRLHIIQCDITDETSMAKAKSFCVENLPPVRGIIHGGMVLRDHPLEYMSLEDYNKALRPKVHGTINLHSAFASNSLSFFICLSSVAGILGMTAQSNYAAGNNFQDAFSHAYSAAYPHTRYITLDLGAIDGSDSITLLPIRRAELERQSAIFMTFDELFVALEYAMGTQAEIDGATQCVIGFDRASMAGVGDSFAMNAPLFSQVPYTQTQQNQSKIAADKSTDPGYALQNAKSMAEAENIITQATAEKFSVFLDTTVPVDVPITQLALDSLVSIELKNWMVRTFDASMQSSELAGAKSIASLAKLLASRSKHLSDELRGKQVLAGDSDEANPNPISGDKALQNGEPHEHLDSEIPSHGFACCKYAKELPKHPLVDLDYALDFFFENTSHFSTPSELIILKEAIEEMRGPVGRAAYAAVVKKFEDPDLDGWMYDLMTDAVHLKRPDPLAPHSNVLGTHFDSKTPHSQSERAAVIAVAAWKFKQSIDADKVEPFWYFGMSSCTWQWEWLFNSTRLPGVEGDVMQLFDSQYCAVLRRGHVFKVMLREDDGQDVSYEKLKATFELILNSVGDEGEWLGIATTDKRDSWAMARDRFLNIDSGNAKYLKVIDEATFLVCLDDGNPETDEERVRQAYLGDGFNRWQDKCIQFIVSENGRSGFIIEHGAIDGMTAARSCDWIHDAIQTHQRENSRPFPEGQITLDEYKFKSNSELDAYIMKIRERYLAVTSTFDYRLHNLAAFGTDYLLNAQCPAKAVIDATLHLAIRLHYGVTTPCWEPVSMAHYHKGRPDVLQTATRPVSEFCDAAISDQIPLVEQRAMLLSLGRDIQANLQKSLEAKNYMRLFDLLDLLWPKDAPRARIFRDALHWRNPVVIAAHAPAGNAVCNSANGLKEADSIWTMITPEKEFVRFSIVGPAEGTTDAFVQRLDEAAQIIKNIIDAK